MNSSLSRRVFLRSAGFGLAGAWVSSGWLRASPASGGLLRIGFVGVANRGGANLADTASCKDLAEVTALCDVDSNNLEAAAAQHPKAAKYRDFRKMLEKEQLDAVVVSTPDHAHAVVCAAGLRRGLHVYCEKPLARTVSEVRAIQKLAAKTKRVTQLGTQIHAGANYRRVVELVQAKAVGDIREVHVWVGATYGGMERPQGEEKVPPQLDWDLWLGPVEPMPYSAEYAPFKWRNWWAFGGGSLADFGCHFMDLPHWALQLSHPDWVEPVDGPPVHPHSTPPWAIVRYHHPARASVGQGSTLPPVTLTWYHGGKQPALLDEEQAKYFKSGVLFVGEKGSILADYTRNVLLPEEKFKDYKRPQPWIPASVGHHREWLLAIRGEMTTTCGFAYSGPLSETALLGNVAYRLGKRITWDAAALRARKCPEADVYLKHHYRKGWAL